MRDDPKMCREVAANEPSERECMAIAVLGKLVARRALPDVNEIMIGRIMLLDIVNNCCVLLLLLLFSDFRHNSCCCCNDNNSL